MTDCEQALREIEAYLDGELEPSSLRELEVHFEDCTPCADRADFQRKLKSLIAGKCASAPSVPPGLRARIDEIVRGEHTR